MINVLRCVKYIIIKMVDFVISIFKALTLTVQLKYPYDTNTTNAELYQKSICGK